MQSYGRGFPEESECVDRYDPPDQEVIFLEDGPKSGLGPLNCGEPTGSVLDDVCVKLTQDGNLDASRIEVSINDTVVTLRGAVGSEGDKRRAGQIVRAIDGVSSVDNRLEVRPE